MTPSASDIPVDATAMTGGFAPFTVTHLVVVIVSAAIAGSVIALGRRWIAIAPARERALRRMLAGSILIASAGSLGYWTFVETFDAQLSLPLHICDLVPWIAAIALLANGPAWRWTRTITWFWGIGLSSWAFIYPVLRGGPDTAKFWWFWLVHLGIVLAAAYLVLAMRFRPTRRDLGVAAAAIVAYAAAMTPLNLALDADYGYVGDDPQGPTAILGPWPWRIPIIVIGQAVIFAAVWFPVRALVMTGADIDRRRPS